MFPRETELAHQCSSLRRSVPKYGLKALCRNVSQLPQQRPQAGSEGLNADSFVAGVFLTIIPVGNVASSKANAQGVFQKLQSARGAKYSVPRMELDVRAT